MYIVNNGRKLVTCCLILSVSLLYIKMEVSSAELEAQVVWVLLRTTGARREDKYSASALSNPSNKQLKGAIFMYFPQPGTAFSSSSSQTTLPPAIVTSTFPFNILRKHIDFNNLCIPWLIRRGAPIMQSRQNYENILPCLFFPHRHLYLFDSGGILR